MFCFWLVLQNQQKPYIFPSERCRDSTTEVNFLSIFHCSLSDADIPVLTWADHSQHYTTPGFEDWEGVRWKGKKLVKRCSWQNKEDTHFYSINKRKKKKKNLGDFWRKVSAKGPELCIALRKVWKECRRVAEDGEERAGQHYTVTIVSLPQKSYRHSEVSLCLSMCSAIFVSVKLHYPPSLFH